MHNFITFKLLFTLQLSLRDNPLVVRFVSNMMLNPPSLLEHAGRTIKVYGIPYGAPDLPMSLVEYLNSAHHCVNPKCKGSGHTMVPAPTFLIIWYLCLIMQCYLQTLYVFTELNKFMSLMTHSQKLVFGTK